MVWPIAILLIVVLLAVIALAVVALQGETMTSRSWLLMKQRPRGADKEAVRQILGRQNSRGRAADKNDTGA